MGISKYQVGKYQLGRQIAACLILFCGLQVSEIAEAMPPPISNTQQDSSAPAQESSQPAVTKAQSPQSSAPLPGADQPQAGVANPVGTAAAPAAPVTGIAAARPAGAAIAPAKQRRARTIMIRISIVIGAAVAVGTVAALSHASPSHPN
jgi:hypothetical protein